MSNKAKCLNCGDVIESLTRHHFVACGCFENVLDNKGIYLDGGDEYHRYGGCIENLEWIYD